MGRLHIDAIVKYRFPEVMPQVDLILMLQVATLPRIVNKWWPDHGIDVLVNNAGMARNNGSLFDGHIGSWVEMLSTNILGTCMCTRVVLQVICP